MSGLSAAVLAVIGLANGVIGACIGICGIAGFLLPMLYTGALGYDVDRALAYSFLAFLVSGCIGSFYYHKQGNLDVSMSVKLGAGSLIGAVLGVFLQSFIAKDTVKVILYVVVLFSGLSILLRMWKEKKSAEETLDAKQAGGGTEIIIKQKKLTDSMVFLVALGVITGAICSLSGAGGPVLVMPLLVVFGVSARAAVGVALFDSVFIAVPACAGYLSRIDWKAAFGVLALIVATHGVGVWDGKPRGLQGAGAGTEAVCWRIFCGAFHIYAGILKKLLQFTKDACVFLTKNI